MLGHCTWLLMHPGEAVYFQRCFYPLAFIPRGRHTELQQNEFYFHSVITKYFKNRREERLKLAVRPLKVDQKTREMPAGS